MNVVAANHQRWYDLSADIGACVKVTVVRVSVRQMRLAAAVASVLVVGSLAISPTLGGSSRAGAATAPTAPGTTLYVGTGAVACNDNGPATQAEPFCTLQAAANVVNPGQTVVIQSGLSKPVTITRSGTPSEPITFTVAGASRQFVGSAQTGQAVVTIQNVHDVTISGIGVNHYDGDDGIDVAGSSAITLDRLMINHIYRSPAAEYTSAGISIDGASSDVTVSRTRIQADGQYGLHVAAGAQHVTADDNAVLMNGAAAAMWLDGAAGSVVTGNTLLGVCAASTGTNGLALTGGSSAVVENNVFQDEKAGTCSAYGAALLVDSASAGSVQASYNALFSLGGPVEYSWAGATYTTAAQFQAAVPGQGANDVDLRSGVGLVPPPEGSAAIDSADCTAPAYSSTDFAGNPRVADPLATDARDGAGADPGRLPAR